MAYVLPRLALALLQCLVLFSILILDAAAEPALASLRLKGAFQDGPLVGYLVKGHCSYDPKGDPLEQTGKCTVTATGPQPDLPTMTIQDNDARIALVVGRTVLEISLGPTVPNTGTKGNRKLELIKVTTFLGGQHVLVPPPGVEPTGFEGNSGSISIGGVSASSSDCLIYDFVGPDVHDASR